MPERLWLIKMRGERTQETIANSAKISRSAYSNIESGKRNPSVKTAKKIAAVLNFNWELFFDEKCFTMKNIVVKSA